MIKVRDIVAPMKRDEYAVSWVIKLGVTFHSLNGSFTDAAYGLVVDVSGQVNEADMMANIYLVTVYKRKVYQRTIDNMPQCTDRKILLRCRQFVKDVLAGKIE